ncbi:MAG: alpha-2-macroglobulin, partial [Chitinophagaceae bacterium]|nr:alpha-2-macroglobulin [Chitinophagaceae bacterium]
KVALAFAGCQAAIFRGIDWFILSSTSKPPATTPIQTRKNFNETAFFFPDLQTDSNGVIEFSFTIPEALTQWKWMSLAHTKEAAFGYSQKMIVTQKDLMVQSNAPRFLREGDRMDFTTKIVNMTGKEMTGQVELQLIDPSTNQPVDGWFRNFFPNQYFTAAAGQSALASFTIETPFEYNKPVIYRVIARSGDISDGEEMTLPVVSNRTLVTESLPLNLTGNGTKQFKFEKLINSVNSESLLNHSFSIEFSSNPAWYAVQALPTLLENNNESADQLFNRFYVNAIAVKILNSNTRLRDVFNKWRITDTSALMSNLEKNQELKSVLLQETPWVFEAKSESQQKKQLALVFDLVRATKDFQTSISRLAEMQSENGGFVWFPGGPDDRYMTQYIITGLGHLAKLGALPANDRSVTSIINRGLSYLDKKLIDDYNKLVARKANLTTTEPDQMQIQYLYMRSFFTNMSVPGSAFKAYNYYRKQAQLTWVKQSRYMQGMIALSLHRTGDVQTAKNILKSLQQFSISSEEMGMYWKEVSIGGYYWHQSPIEAHALLTEAFVEIVKDNAITNKLKTWLLKQKLTRNWKTTKATAEACYVLLLEGTDWTASQPVVEIGLNSIPFYSSKNEKSEEGTGYFKKSVDVTKIDPAMGNISVTVSNSTAGAPAWGAAHWQYFEDLEKITASTGSLKLNKKLFIEKIGDRGAELHPLNDGDALHVGDKIKVRIELRTDRTLEYVHMKDMRASSLEPTNVISSYKWQGGLGYYESTKDVSTNFFFGTLPKGTWVFEYSLSVTHTGTFSNGITSVQCLYAPEFGSHSEGIRIRVE